MTATVFVLIAAAVVSIVVLVAVTTDMPIGRQNKEPDRRSWD